MCDLMRRYFGYSWLGVSLMVVMGGCTDSTRSSGKIATQSQAQGSSSEAEYTSDAAKKSAANAELFREMFSVVLRREPQDRASFGNWVDTLNQGASLEGVYHGLVHSKDYEKLESSGPAASKQTIQVFKEEWDRLSLDSKINLTPPVNLGSASVFSLKRILGEKALRFIEVKSSQKEALSQWYGKWVTQMASRSVDFGVSLRNKPDELFHTQWAMQNSEDRLKWEVLNRIHRVLNEMENKK